MKKRVVQAGEFEVVDERGAVRLRIGLTNDEDPFFSLLSPDGQVRMRFGLGNDGSAGLAIGDDNGKVRATVGLSSDGSASLAFGDKNGKIRAKFGLAPEASPTMGMQVKDGELSQVYSLAEQGSPTIGLYDNAGKVRVRLGLAAEGSPVMRLLDRDGDLRAVVGLASDGTPVRAVPRRRQRAHLDDALAPTVRRLDGARRRCEASGLEPRGIHPGRARSRRRRSTSRPAIHLSRLPWLLPASVWHRPPRPARGPLPAGPRLRACRTPRFARGSSQRRSRRRRELSPSGVNT